MTIRLAIIGTGAMAAAMTRAAHARAGMEPAAVISSDAGRAAAFAARFGIARHGTDAAAILAGVDAAYVATANAGHGPAVRAAIAAGRPVLVEKPLTPTPQDTAALIDAAQAASVLLVENWWTLALPAVRAIVAEAQGGSLGATRHLSFDFSYPVAPAAMPGLFAADGGVLLDRAGYGIALALTLLGPVAEMSALITRRDGIDTAAALQLRHTDGATAQISVSLDALGGNGAVLHLERGRLSLGHSSLGAEWLMRAGMAPVAGRADPLAPAGAKDRLKAALKESPLLRRLRGGWDAGRFMGYGPGIYDPVLAHFAALVREGATESPLIPHSLSRRVAELVDGARRA